jgi:hypothetical protein
MYPIAPPSVKAHTTLGVDPEREEGNAAGGAALATG